MELAELLSKADGADADWWREGVRVLAQALMDAEVSEQIGAEHGQRNPERLTHRNGYRPREWDTRVGTVELQIPRLLQGSYLPSWLEPRRRAERALCAVVAQCYVEGVSTRRVDDIARAKGNDGISKSQVSRICAHHGLKAAIGAVLAGASWQRCRTHYADLRVMPMLRVDPLQDRGFGLARSA